MKFRTVQLGSPRKRGEGLRIGAVRYPPRGVRKEDYARFDHFDVWLPTLAPSRELLAEYKDGSLSPRQFFSRYRQEMRATDPRQVIETLARVSLESPIAVGCYCDDHRVCHRSVLGELIRSAIPLHPRSIYTITHPEHFDSWLAHVDGRGEIEEHTRWVSGARMLDDARDKGENLPLLLADATNCRRLTHWALIEDVHLADHETRVRFHGLRALSGRHRPQELVKTNGEHIAPGYIRPYALCTTPDFL